jgi:hypothetical protein
MSAWDEVRDAIAAKLDASAGCAAAGLRRASTKVDGPIGPDPEVRVLQPGFTMMAQTGSSEEYVLEVPFELLVGRPAGTRRSNPKAADIARAIQVEFQTGITLGLALGLVTIVDARLLSMTPGLVEYQDSGLDGYRGVVSVQVFESVTRTG